MNSRIFGSEWDMVTPKYEHDVEHTDGNEEQNDEQVHTRTGAPPYARFNDGYEHEP